MGPNFPGTECSRAWTHGRRLWLRCLLLTLAAVLTLGQPLAALAQAPRSLRIPPVMLPTPLDDDPSLQAPSPQVQVAAARRVIVDTDPGVDDALALLWLLTQSNADVVGIVTVAGNTTVENATNNVQLLLAALGPLGMNIPVIQGAEKPLNQRRSRANHLIHGPDGLWGLSFGLGSPSAPGSPPADPNPNKKPDVTAAVNFYCGVQRGPNQVQASALAPGTLVLALGPLTNIASAVDKCPAAWDRVEVVSVGGAKFGGNQTPTTEYNYWQDPEAAAIVAQKAARFFFDFDTFEFVYGPGYRLTIVPFDAFSQFTPFDVESSVDAADDEELTFFDLLMQAVAYYYYSLGSEGDPVAFPDVAAALYALDNTLGTSYPALVKVLNGKDIPELVRGQSIIGLGFNERISMIAGDAELSIFADRALTDPNFDFELEVLAILSRELDNALVVMDLDEEAMSEIFHGELFDILAVSSTAQPEATHKLFLPGIR